MITEVMEHAKEVEVDEELPKTLENESEFS